MAATSILWELEEHSLGKHLVLKRYLNAWLPILSRFHGRLLIIDGFSGPGEYSNGHVGSPIIAIDTVLQHRDKAAANQEVVFYFIEKDKRRLDHLKALISQRYQRLPTNIVIEYCYGRFDETMANLLNAIEEQNATLAPCFAMIDPFGVSDTPMSIIQRLLKNPKAEVYVSVMFEFINRFLGSPEFEPHLDTLFGCREWRAATALEGKSSKREFLYQLYKNGLKEAGAENVVHYDLYKGNRHVYGIFFATKAWLGSDRMKEAIWKIAPEGNFIFRGGQNAVLDISQPNFQPLIDVIVQNFSGKWVSPNEIAAFVGSGHTLFYSGQMKKCALRILEEAGRLEVHPDNLQKRRRNTYPSGILIRIT